MSEISFSFPSLILELFAAVPFLLLRPAYCRILVDLMYLYLSAGIRMVRSYAIRFRYDQNLFRFAKQAPRSAAVGILLPAAQRYVNNSGEIGVTLLY